MKYRLKKSQSTSERPTCYKWQSFHVYSIYYITCHKLWLYEDLTYRKCECELFT